MSTSSKLKLDAISAFFLCIECKTPMRDAYTLIPCMHKLCRNCADKSTTCPSCRVQISSKGPDVVFSHMVEQSTKAAIEQLAGKAVQRYGPVFPSLKPEEMKALIAAHFDRGGENSDVEITQMLFLHIESRKALQVSIHQVNIFWDFDQYFGWTSKDVEQLYHALLDYLIANDAELCKSQIKCVAVGTNFTFQDPAVIQTLQDMDVRCQVVSSMKNEEADRYIERLMSAVVKKPGQTTTEVVLISSDKDFQSVVRTLENESDIRVMVLHNAERGSRHEQLLSLSPTTLLHLSELISVPLSKQPSTSSGADRASGFANSRSPALAPRPPRLIGTVVRWGRDTSGKHSGIINHNSHDVFLDSTVVVHGAPSVGCHISFRCEPSPDNSSHQLAYDAVVLEDGEEVGTVSKWGQSDKFGMAYGFVATADGASHYLATNDLAGSAPCVGDEMVYTVAASLAALCRDEMVYTVAASLARVGTTQAKHAVLLRLRSVVAQAALPSAVPDPPSAVAPTRTTSSWLERVGRPSAFPPLTPAQSKAPTTNAPTTNAPTMRSMPSQILPSQWRRPQRFVGRLTHWDLDKSGKYYGHVEHASGAVFLHATHVVRGAPSQGCRISFRSESNPKNPEQKQAYDAVVLDDCEEVGIVSKWVEGCGTVTTTEGDDHALDSTDLVSEAPSVEDEVVFRVVIFQGKRLAKNAAVLALRGSAKLQQQVPPPTALPSASSAQRPPRTVSFVRQWNVDSSGAHRGVTESGVSFSGTSVIHGTPTDGCRVSFRIDASRAATTAYDIVVLGEREMVGIVIRWDLKDKHGSVYGFITEGDSSDSSEGAYLSALDVIGASGVVVGSECVYTLHVSLIVANGTVAKNARLLPCK
ncbi:Hypothetical protein, putative [Bodo saltans]|uniref:RING-type domain-containing protein n=1 Tax=Bodo saltans TaxID=75058 RepID=A0A0S4JAW6_BODSA|nr:Hypothetical protein, putative [Bodo saltans]|eukprot:CUG88663.1 Hypothetical protein, putative [Bodo saltans]